MKVYSYSQARQRLTEVLNRSRSEDVIIRRRGGEAFRICPQLPDGSPLDVRGVRTGTTTADIIRVIREVRRRQGVSVKRPAKNDPRLRTTKQ
jgi:prevent-host-death family protein